MKFPFLGTTLIQRLQRLEVVRTEIEIHFCRFFACRIEECIHFSRVILDISASLLFHSRFYRNLFEILLSDKYRREELVFERHPVNAAFQLLIIIFSGRQVIYIFTCHLIGQLRQTILVSESFFQLAGTLRPVNVHIFGACQFVRHTCSLDFKVHQVAVRFQRIYEVNIAFAVRSQTHGDTAIRLVHCFKEIILCLNSTFFIVEVEIHRSIITVEQHDRSLLILCHVILQHG